MRNKIINQKINQRTRLADANPKEFGDGLERCLQNMKRIVEDGDFVFIPENIENFEKAYMDYLNYIKQARSVLSKEEVNSYKTRADKLNQEFLSRIC